MTRLSALLCLLPLAAGAIPQPSEELPAFTAHDLEGREQALPEGLSAHRRTLLVAITNRDASPLMREWYARADDHVSNKVHRESVISLHLPFFVGEGTARGKARDEVPREFWDDTLLDARGQMAKKLGLPDSELPYVMVLDARGRVLASFHGAPDDPGAAAIWRAAKP